MDVVSVQRVIVCLAKLVDSLRLSHLLMHSYWHCIHCVLICSGGHLERQKISERENQVESELHI